MEQIPKPKRVERIPIKRASYQKRIESVELSRDGSSRVVDLRSIAAKKESQKRAEQQREHEAELEIAREQQAAQLKQQLKAERRTEQRVKKERVSLQERLSSVGTVFQKIKPHRKKRAVEQAESTTFRKSRLTPVIESARGYFKKLLTPVTDFFTRLSHGLRNHVASLTDVQRQTLKSMRNFALILCLIIVPVTVAAAFAQVQQKEDRLTQQSEEAFAHMLAAGKSIQSLNFETSADKFTRAKQSLDAVDAELDGLNGLLLWVGQWIPGKGQQAYAAGQLIDAGSLLAASGVRLSEEAATIQATQENSPDELLRTIATSAKNLGDTAEDIHAARKIIDGIDVSDIPEDKRAQLTQVKTVLPIFDDAFRQGMTVTDGVLNLLGAQGDRRYIILFQNNRELRPTGGFIGSLAIVTVRDGFIQAFDAPGGGVYDIAGQLDESVISPKPLHLVNASWNLQDANWFPSFPDSAKKVQWFYERSNGATVDGVIAITPDVLEKVMGVIGEVTVDDEGVAVTVNADNIYSVLQSRDDEDLLEGAKPKTLISNLTPVIMNRMIESAQDPKGAAQMLTILGESLNEKDVLLTVNDADIQSIFSTQGWTSEIAAAKSAEDGEVQDYLYVNHANVAGGKTDQVIEETINHSAEIAADGTITDTVKITRVHKGDSDNPLENVKNNSYTRVYIPENSELLEVSGFENPPAKAFFTPDEDAEPDEDLKRISGESLFNDQLNVSTNTEYGKSVIGGWMITDVGESTTVTIKYQLPFKITMGKWFNPTDRYELLIQKQPGMRDPYVVSSVKLPESMEASAWYPDLEDGAQDATHALTVLLSDDITRGVLLTKKQ
jgi:hypothetical protein